MIPIPSTPRVPYPPSTSHHSCVLGRGLILTLFFPLDGRSPVSHPTCEVPFPPRRSGEYRKGMIPARPLYQGGCGSVWDPEPSKERVGDWGGPATVWSLLCVAETRAGRTESGGIVLAANAGPRVPSGGVTLKKRCTYRPSVIYLIVNKRLSLSLSQSRYGCSTGCTGPQTPKCSSSG
jgi:hypothetical protein